MNRSRRITLSPETATLHSNRKSTKRQRVLIQADHPVRQVRRIGRDNEVEQASPLTCDTD